VPLHELPSFSTVPRPDCTLDLPMLVDGIGGAIRKWPHADSGADEKIAAIPETRGDIADDLGMRHGMNLRMELTIVNPIGVGDLCSLRPSGWDGRAFDDGGQGSTLLLGRTLRGELRAESLGMGQDDKEIADLLLACDHDAATNLRNDLQEAFCGELLERLHDRLAAAPNPGNHVLDAYGVTGSECALKELFLQEVVGNARKAAPAVRAFHSSILALHSGDKA